MWNILTRKSKEDDLGAQFGIEDDNETKIKMQDVYQAMHFIFTDMKHHGYWLQSFRRLDENEYEVTLSDGYQFTITNESFDSIPVILADEFNRHYREDICHLD